MLLDLNKCVCKMQLKKIELDKIIQNVFVILRKSDIETQTFWQWEKFINVQRVLNLRKNCFLKILISKNFKNGCMSYSLGRPQ